MRSRTNSGAKRDSLMYLVHRTILNKMDPITGLFKSNYPGFEDHAWVRDNVYAVHCVWALSLAFKKHADADEDRIAGYELEQVCVKVMRSLLECMMGQRNKVELFKRTQNQTDALHAKYGSRTLDTVTGDFDWGHLQIDATSLYLLTMAQLTASGLLVIFSLDEVAFIQNLVYYIENAYRIPDYGIWERGDKTNHGVTELNATSIGMAKAALEAVNDLDLFGAHGSTASVIHVPVDEIQQCNAVLESLLPRESLSKETDAGLLSIISYPAFAVEDIDLIAFTRNTILSKLRGRYGCKRFLRDGYKTPLEDQRRLYYEPWELARFEKVECEWPLFFCYLMLDGFYADDKQLISEMKEELESLVLTTDEGLELIPELYAIGADQVEAEKAVSGSQARFPGGHTPFVWAQSLYVICKLLDENFIQVAELDPLNRRLSTDKRLETVVQVVVIAEDEEVQERLRSNGLGSNFVQRIDQIDPMFSILSSSNLSRIWEQLGRSDKLNLSGRPVKDVGLLQTSKLYSLQDKFLVFTPQFLDKERFYLIHDIHVMIDLLKMELKYVHDAWNQLGRPLVICRVNRDLVCPIDESEAARKRSMAVIGTLRKIKSGYVGRTKVKMGKLEDFVTTSCITSLDFLCSTESEIMDEEFGDFLRGLTRVHADGDTDGSGHHHHGGDEDGHHHYGGSANGLLPGSSRLRAGSTSVKRLESVENNTTELDKVRFVATRHKSIFLDANDSDLHRLRLKYTSGQPDDLIGGGVGGEYDYNTGLVMGIKPYGNNSSNPFMLGGGGVGGGRTLDDIPDTLSTMSEGWTSNTAGGESGEQSGDKDDYDDDDDDEGSLKTPTIPNSVTNETRATNPNSPNQTRITSISTRSSRIDLEALEELESSSMVEMLSLTESVEEQGDIVYCLWLKKLLGPDWKMKIKQDDREEETTVHQLVDELHKRACREHVWWLVRLTSGMLEKKIEDLSKSVTDLLVRQKQITVGMPAHGETNISAPLPPHQLQAIIRKSVGNDDINSSVLTQEILVYLGMFVRTEPKLFSEMLRLRVGLIIQIMASELGRALKSVSAEEATQQLLNLCPHEIKTLLYNILSGKEIEVGKGHSSRGSGIYTMTSKREAVSRFVKTKSGRKKSIIDLNEGKDLWSEEEDDETDEDDACGHWLRRRRIDGALNRVPQDFYSKVWKILTMCEGLSIEGHVIHQNSTKEMTSEEIKFANGVEGVLNRIPDPEYRQLLVESIMVLTLLRENNTTLQLPPGVIPVDMIVKQANQLFLQDQREDNGDATECCANIPSPTSCNGVAGICRHFYDSPPSGAFGTMTYIARSLVAISPSSTDINADIECHVS